MNIAIDFKQCHFLMKEPEGELGKGYLVVPDEEKLPENLFGMKELAVRVVNPSNIFRSYIAPVDKLTCFSNMAWVLYLTMKTPKKATLPN